MLEHRKKRNIKITVLKIFCIILFFSFLFYFFISNLQVKKIILEPDRISCGSQDELKSYIKIGQNIVFFNEDYIKKKLSARFLCISSIEISKKFPDTLVLKLQERKAAVLISIIQDRSQTLFLKTLNATPSSEEAILMDSSIPPATSAAKFLSDNSGFIFSQTSADQNILTILIDDDKIALGKVVTDEIVPKSLKIVDKLNAFSIPVKTVEVFDEKIITRSSPKIIFSLSNNIDRQLAPLQLILQKAKIESQVINFVDLRFNKPVVVYSK